MKNKLTQLALFLFGIIVIQACIGDDFLDDFVEPELRILSSIDTLALNSEFMLDAQYLNNIGQEEAVDVLWSSTNENIASVNQQGIITGLAEGSSTIIAIVNSDGSELRDSINIIVAGSMNVFEFQQTEGMIETTTFYTLEGDFIWSETENGVRLEIADNYVASANLPGLYIYLSNNRNSISEAFEISEVTTFRGAHNYEIEDLGFSDYRFIVYFCKPFNVKVGEAVLQ